MAVTVSAAAVSRRTGRSGSRGDERRECGGQCDADPADEQDPEADAPERMVGRLERLGHDDGARACAVLVEGRRDELAEMDARAGGIRRHVASVKYALLLLPLATCFARERDRERGALGRPVGSA